MSTEIAAQLRLLALSMGAGARLALVYAGLLLFRCLLRHGAVLSGAEDAAYWCFSAFYTFSVLFRENDGVLRLYVLAALLLTRSVIVQVAGRILRKVLKKQDGCYKIEKTAGAAKRGRDRKQKKTLPPQTEKSRRQQDQGSQQKSVSLDERAE